MGRPGDPTEQGEAPARCPRSSSSNNLLRYTRLDSEMGQGTSADVNRGPLGPTATLPFMCGFT